MLNLPYVGAGCPYGAYCIPATDPATQAVQASALGFIAPNLQVNLKAALLASCDPNLDLHIGCPCSCLSCLKCDTLDILRRRRLSQFFSKDNPWQTLGAIYQQALQLEEEFCTITALLAAVSFHIV